MSTNCSRIYKQNNNKKSSQPKLPLHRFSTLSTSDFLSLSLHLCFLLFLLLCSQSWAYADCHQTVEMSDRICISTEHTDTQAHTYTHQQHTLQFCIWPSPISWLTQDVKITHRSHLPPALPLPVNVTLISLTFAERSAERRASLVLNFQSHSQIIHPIKRRKSCSLHCLSLPEIKCTALPACHSPRSLPFFMLLVLDSQTVMYVFMLRYISHNITFLRKI